MKRKKKSFPKLLDKVLENKKLVLVLSAILLPVGVFGAGNLEYWKASGLLESTSKLVIEKDFEMAEENLSQVQASLISGLFGQRLEEVEDEITYAKGKEAFDNGNLEEAKIFLSQVSAKSTYYIDAWKTLEKIQESIVEERISESVTETREELESQIEQEKQRRILAEAENKAAEEKAKQEIETLKKAVEEASYETKYTKEDAELLGLTTYSPIAVIPKGTKVTVVGQKPNVFHVKVSGQEGWIWYSLLVDQIDNTPNLASIIDQWKPQVAYIECGIYLSNGSYYPMGGGSGTVFKSSSGEILIRTNKHVLTNGDAYVPDLCLARFLGISKVYTVGLDDLSIATSGIDLGFLQLRYVDTFLESITSSQGTYCTNRPSVGDQVVILGYPGIGSKTDITATDGIISGYEGVYYITSAKVEQGNSGGAAVLVKDNCYLGIPTSVIPGAFESLARILDVNAQ